MILLINFVSINVNTLGGIYMKKRIVLIVLLGSFFFLSLSINTDRKGHVAKEEKMAVEEHTYAAGEEIPLESTCIGDPGESDEIELSINSKFSVDNSMEKRKYMLKLVFDHNGYIPFADGQRYYGKGYFKSPDGIDNLRNSSPVGMDSLGYVIWVYRNTFGYCDPLFNNPIEYYQKSQKVTVSELQVGDVGMYTNDEGEKNHFGIFVGYEQGIPVFSHCSNLVAPKYPCGNDRLSFLQSSTNSYYLGNAPVELNYFFRPDMPWEE